MIIFLGFMVKIIHVEEGFFPKKTSLLDGYLSFLDNSDSNMALYVFNPGTLLKANEDDLSIFPKSDLFQKWKINPLRNLDDSFLGKSKGRLLLKGKRGHYFEIKEENNKKILNFLRAPYKRIYYMDKNEEDSFREFFSFNSRKIRENLGKIYFFDGNKRGLKNFLYKSFKRNSLL